MKRNKQIRAIRFFRYSYFVKFCVHFPTYLLLTCTTLYTYGALLHKYI